VSGNSVSECEKRHIFSNAHIDLLSIIVLSVES
jgi:hypothetical protein